jgi:hypothetical protein
MVEVEIMVNNNKDIQRLICKLSDAVIEHQGADWLGKVCITLNVHKGGARITLGVEGEVKPTT